MDNKKEKIVVFSGAGISAESGLKTFRDSGGLWEEYDIYEVATPEAFESNPQLVLDFYNMRRAQLKEASPNDAHRAIVQLEQQYDVTVVTQNVDDLHERAGSSRVVHLHGELTKVRCSVNASDSRHIGYEHLEIGDLSDKGHQLRPDIVWFGEPVPMMDVAFQKIQQADILIVVGTSLNVYPAAGLVHATSVSCKKYLIDPNAHEILNVANMKIINEKAGTGMSRLSEFLLEKPI